jgi:hypothetical protein
MTEDEMDFEKELELFQKNLKQVPTHQIKEKYSAKLSAAWIDSLKSTIRT